MLEEFQKGYTLNERVIRPSKVIVNKLAPKADPEETDGSGATEAQSEDEAQEEPSNAE